MDAHELGARVRDAVPDGVDDQAVEAGIYAYTHQQGGPYARSDVQNVRGLIAGLGLEGGPLADEGEKAAGDPVLGLLDMPSATVLSEEAWDALTPWAEETRREIERRAEHPTELPLDGYGEAVRWIEQEEELATWPETEVSRLWDQAAEVNESAGVEVAVQLRRWLVTYLPEGKSWAHRAAGPKGSSLWVLGEATTQKAGESPFSAHQLVGFVLAGVRSPITPVTVTTSLHSTGHREVRLAVRVPDLSDRDMRKIRDRIRAAWSARGSKRLSERDRAVYTTVRQLGGPPTERGTKGDFWERVREELREQGLNYRRYESVQQAWDRLQERIDGWRDAPPELDAPPSEKA